MEDEQGEDEESSPPLDKGKGRADPVQDEPDEDEESPPPLDKGKGRADPVQDEPGNVKPEPIPSLEEQKALRIFMARAPGTGHQGATVALMQRLQHLGFNGKYDVIYDDTIPPGEEDKYGSNPQKLESLLPGFQPDGDAIQNFTTQGLDVQVMSLSAFQAQSNPMPAQYGLTGAVDDKEKPEDLLGKLQVDAFAQLQPMDWKDGQRGIAYKDKDGNEHFDEVQELDGLGYIYDSTAPDDPQGMIQDELGKVPGGNDKLPGILAFLDQSNKQEANTMLVYGLGTSTGKGGTLFGLFNLTKGMMYAQDHGDLGKKGVIVAAAGWTDEDESKTLTNMLNGDYYGGLRRLFYEDDPQEDDEDAAPEGEAPEGEDNLAQASNEPGEHDSYRDTVNHLKSNLFDPNQQPRGKVLDIGDQSAAESIRNVQPGEVLVVKLGRLPMSVFEYMRTQTTLPNGFESVNGMDKERQNKPYFHVGKDVSNKFPEQVDGMDDKSAAAIAKQNVRVGEQFQGSNSISTWERNYKYKTQTEILKEAKDAKIAVKTAKGADVTITSVLGTTELRGTRHDPNNQQVPVKISGKDNVEKFFERNKATIESELRKQDPDKVIGDFMSETQDPGSELNQYFNLLKARSKDKDQVAIAWMELTKSREGAQSRGYTHSSLPGNASYGNFPGSPGVVSRSRSSSLKSSGSRR